jgi:type VI secretion system secreted protein Hcp
MSYQYILTIPTVSDAGDGGNRGAEIEVLSFTFGVRQTGSLGGKGGGSGAGRVEYSDLSVTRASDRATAMLFQHCARGVHLPEVFLTICRAGSDDGGRRRQRQPYMEYLFSDVVITGVQPGGSAHGADTPTESVSLNYTKMTMTYVEQKRPPTPPPPPPPPPTGGT